MEAWFVYQQNTIKLSVRESKYLFTVDSNDCINSVSYEQRKMAERRGMHDVPIGIQIETSNCTICWKNSWKKECICWKHNIKFAHVILILIVSIAQVIFLYILFRLVCEVLVE